VVELSEILKQGAYYPVMDRIPGSVQPYHQYRAIWTGGYRAPKKGEFYLSGAIIEAYMAPNDYSAPYHIARIVRVVKVEYYVEI